MYSNLWNELQFFFRFHMEMPCIFPLHKPFFSSMSADQWEIIRQQLFCNSDFWPCGPYPLDDEDEADDGEGWVYYDTSNWKPPNK